MLTKPVLPCRADVYAYMAFHTTVYLSPFLEGKDEFWEPAMFLITRRKRSRAVTKSRLCLRLADRLLPSLTMVAIEGAATITPLFSELMVRLMKNHRKNGRCATAAAESVQKLRLLSASAYASFCRLCTLRVFKAKFGLGEVVSLRYCI